MPRRAKLVLLSILLVLLAIPIWHAGSNWAPADPLRFRLISRERLPALEREGEEEEKGERYRSEMVEIEVRNTSTAPRFLENVQIRWYSGKTGAPFEYYNYLVDAHHVEGPVIPPGGTWRGRCQLSLPESDSESEPDKANSDPGYVQLEYYHASTFRREVLTRYSSFCFHYLPPSQQLRFMIRTCTSSTAPMEDFP